MYRDIAEELETLAEEYKRVWRIADAEKRQTGRVSGGTRSTLIGIEAQLVELVA